MLKSCAKCGRVHSKSYQCGPKRKYKPRLSELDKFRSTSLWQRKRKQIRDRDLNLCAYCRHKEQPEYVINGLSVHHIIPLEENFDLRLDDDNLITLCTTCHEAAENGDIKREALMELARKASGL